MHGLVTVHGAGGRNQNEIIVKEDRFSKYGHKLQSP
jgi:hypothetical protein